MHGRCCRIVTTCPSDRIYMCHSLSEAMGYSLSFVRVFDFRHIAGFNREPNWSTYVPGEPSKLGKTNFKFSNNTWQFSPSCHLSALGCCLLDHTLIFFFIDMFILFIISRCADQRLPSGFFWSSSESVRIYSRPYIRKNEMVVGRNNQGWREYEEADSRVWVVFGWVWAKCGLSTRIMHSLIAIETIPSAVFVILSNWDMITGLNKHTAFGIAWYFSFRNDEHQLTAKTQCEPQTSLTIFLSWTSYFRTMRAFTISSECIIRSNDSN